MSGKKFCSGCGLQFRNWLEVFYLPSYTSRRSKRMVCSMCIEEEAYFQNAEFDLKKSQAILDDVHSRLEEAKNGA